MKNKDRDKLFTLAYTDSMTGVYNRNAYEERLEKLRRSHTRLDNITIVVTDINGVKAINDTYGHHTGDEAIKLTAECLKKTIGEQADIFRIGGDEFVCIAEKDVFAHISQFMDYLSFEGKDKPYKLSVSVGYSRYNAKNHKSIDDIIKSADIKMYNSKRKGK